MFIKKGSKLESFMSIYGMGIGGGYGWVWSPRAKKLISEFLVHWGCDCDFGTYVTPSLYKEVEETFTSVYAGLKAQAEEFHIMQSNINRQRKAYDKHLEDLYIMELCLKYIKWSSIYTVYGKSEALELHIIVENNAIIRFNLTNIESTEAEELYLHYKAIWGIADLWKGWVSHMEAKEFEAFRLEELKHSDYNQKELAYVLKERYGLEGKKLKDALFAVFEIAYGVKKYLYNEELGVMKDDPETYGDLSLYEVEGLDYELGFEVEEVSKHKSGEEESERKIMCPREYCEWAFEHELFYIEKKAIVERVKQKLAYEEEEEYRRQKLHIKENKGLTLAEKKREKHKEVISNLRIHLTHPIDNLFITQKTKEKAYDLLRGYTFDFDVKKSKYSAYIGQFLMVYEFCEHKLRESLRVLEPYCEYIGIGTLHLSRLQAIVSTYADSSEGRTVREFISGEHIKEASDDPVTSIRYLVGSEPLVSSTFSIGEEFLELITLQSKKLKHEGEVSEEVSKVLHSIGEEPQKVHYE